MYIKYSRTATIVKRINKYVVEVLIDDCVELAHLHDPGRLLDLIYKENIVLLADKSDNLKRKTKWEIIASKDDTGIFILTNTVYHNKLVKEWLLANGICNINIKNIQAEKKYDDSRFDFFVELEDGQEWWVEVKGVTYKKENCAMFPDAPTKRGQKHVRHFIEMKKDNINVMIVFAVFASGVECFRPNENIDKSFYDLFYLAKGVDVNIKALQFELLGNELIYKKELKIETNN